MAVIKAHNSGSLLKEAIVLDLGDLRRQADALRDQAEAEARAIVARAETDARSRTEGAEERGFEEGHAKGLAEGLEAGRTQGRDEAFASQTDHLKTVTDSCQAMADGLESQMELVVREARRCVLEVALRLAEKVVHRVVEIDEETVVRQVEAALAYVLQPTDVSVRFHPDDHAALEHALPALRQRLHDAQHIRLARDEGIERGGCVVSFGKGRVDATLDTQLRRLSEQLLPDRNRDAANENADDAIDDSAAEGMDASPEDSGGELDEKLPRKE